MMKFACVGIAVQDRIYNVENLPNGGGKYRASSYTEVGGGPAATAAVAIARLGAQCDFIGRVGADSVGDTLIKELQKEGVGTQFVRIVADAQSTQSAVLVDKEGERIIVNYPSKSLSSEAYFVERMDFSDYGVVLADVRWHEGALCAFEKAKALNIPTVLDADVTDQDISPLVALATHAVFSEPGLKLFTHEDDIEKALLQAKERCGGHVYVTLGAKGCAYIDDQGSIATIVGNKVKVVDTTGAGDVFHGAFAFALSQKLQRCDNIKFAQAVAALKCTKAGGRAGIPNFEEAMDYFHNQQ